MYKPQPVDVSNVTLPTEIMDLVEQMAEHNHDNWSTGRINEGWVYGPERDDTLKEHPCLVPYNDLPDSEKEYDRSTALTVLKFVYKNGYKIVKA